MTNLKPVDVTIVGRRWSDEAIPEGPVVVTFLDKSSVDLASRGINERRAAELRNRLTAFAKEWDSPEMQGYDDYDDAKSRL